MMSINFVQIQRAAKELWNARVDGRPIAPLSETYPGLSMSDAYHISYLNFQRRVAPVGLGRVGHKVGLTSAAVQKQLGVKDPDFGYISSDMIVPNEGVAKVGKLIAPKVEGEIAFVLSRPLQGPSLTLENVMAAVKYVVPVIEIIDSRVRDWRIRIEDTVADNASSALVVLGSEKVKIEGLDLAKVGMTLKKNGKVESQGSGADCLGHPLQSLLWLANRLRAYGEDLESNDIVLAGAFGPVVSLAPGDKIEVELKGIGSVSCRCEK